MNEDEEIKNVANTIQELKMVCRMAEEATNAFKHDLRIMQEFKEELNRRKNGQRPKWTDQKIQGVRKDFEELQELTQRPTPSYIH